MPPTHESSIQEFHWDQCTNANPHNPYIKTIENHRDLIFSGNLEYTPVWEEEFGKKSPLIVDLGCGAGNFLRDLAVRESDYSYVGVELRYKRLVKASEKFKKRNLNNIRLIQDRGERIRNWFMPQSVRRFHINFPDPWPKKRHHKHRLLKESYLKTLHSLLSNQGELILKTDHSEYFHSTCTTLEDMEEFRILEYSENLHRSSYQENNIVTEFEQLFTGKKIPICYLRAFKQ